MENILIIGANSGIGAATALLLADCGYKIFASSRKGVLDFKHDNIICIKADVTDVDSLRTASIEIGDVEFEAVINFAGIAISSPVEFLDEMQLQKQFDVNVFGLLKVIQNFYPKLAKNTNGAVKGRIINVSSMASYGLFPFISPYCAAKSAGDILLNSFGIETGTKVISIKPGVVKSPFWDASIVINKENFDNFGEKYKKEREFLIKNAQKNSNHGLEPKAVARTILRALEAKNPKPSYTVGFDAKIVQLSSILPKKLVNWVVHTALKTRVK